MLTKPEYGWCHVIVNGEQIGAASYLTDPALDCLQAFIDRLRVEEDSPRGFSVEFDAEGWEFGLIEFGGELFHVHNHNDTCMAQLSSLGFVWDILPGLARECIADIRENMDAWVSWFGDEERDEYIRRALLQEKIGVLEVILNVRERL